VKGKLYESFQGLANMVVSAAPKVVLGIILLLLSILVARVIEKVLRILLVRVRLDNLVQQAGLDKTLQRIGIRQKLDFFIPRLTPSSSARNTALVFLTRPSWIRLSNSKGRVRVGLHHDDCR